MLTHLIQYIRHRLNISIALIMSIAVIDLLQAIQIKEQHKQRLVTFLCLFDNCRRELKKSRTVKNAGQCIIDPHTIQSFDHRIHDLLLPYTLQSIVDIHNK